MDNIIELLIKKETEKTDGLKKFGVVAVTVVLCLLAVLLFGSNTTVVLLLWLGICCGAIKFMQRFDVEFDYCIIDGSMDIDKVLSKKRRKKYISVDKDTIELVAPFGHEELLQFNKYKTYYATNKNDENKFVVVGVTGSKKCKIVITGNERILEHFKMKFPRKVIL